MSPFIIARNEEFCLFFGRDYGAFVQREENGFCATSTRHREPRRLESAFNTFHKQDKPLNLIGFSPSRRLRQASES